MDLSVKPSRLMSARRETNLDGTIPKTWLEAYGPPLLLIVASVLFLDGCQAIKGIFEAGIGVGMVVVIAIVAIVGFIAAMVMRKK
ncbi:MAG: hypothetical protein ABJE95_15290 [Byssovorax sp.]